MTCLVYISGQLLLRHPPSVWQPNLQCGSLTSSITVIVLEKKTYLRMPRTGDRKEQVGRKISMSVHITFISQALAEFSN